MRRFAFVLALAVLLPSCNDDSGPAGPVPDFAGTFLLRYTMGNAALEITCAARGTATVNQSGSTFTGTYEQTGECTGPGASEDFSGAGLITGGSVSGTRVQFDVEECRYQGTLVGNPANGASGDVHCSFSEDGFSFELDGDWAVTLGVASLTVSPDPLGIILDDTVHLSATLRGPDGEELAERAVTWESADPSIVTVDAAGRAERVGLGDVPITATSIPLYPLEEAVTGEVVAEGGLRFVSVETGVDHTCGVTTGGRALCWGWGADGQLGTGEQTFVAPLPVQVAGGFAFKSVSPGFLHTCGIREPEGGYCWGSNLGGALGDGTGQPSAVPVAIDGGGGFDEVVAGTYMSCAMESMGGRYCWGSNDSGQLGIGSIGGPNQLSPVEVLDAGGFTTWSVTRSPTGGGAHTCGLQMWENDLYCWGQGTLGELGNGGTEDHGTPQLVVGDLDFTSVSSGFGHSCGIAEGGDAYCWGYAISGALGTGSTEPVIQPTPVPVTGGIKFESVSAGDHFTCGVATGGEAYCWGWGGSNQLGNGEAVDRLEPTPVAGGLVFTSISAGSGYACGMANSGRAYCWGANGRGQLGTGDQQGRATPTLVGLQK